MPFMSEIALPGDSWEIELNTIIRTLPTIGPLLGNDNFIDRKSDRSKIKKWRKWVK